jgi:hypothetical protein
VADRSGDSIAHGWAPCGSHHVVLSIPPGETREVVFVLGYAENPAGAKFHPPGSGTLDKRSVQPVIDRYRQPAEVDAALERLRTHWHELLGSLQVATPDVHVDRMVNVWNTYQCMVTFNLSRSASSFESGIGRGMGFRDSNQDLLGFVHMIPERARERILDIASTQLPSGGAYHQYQPLTKTGNDDIGSGFNDDPLWLVLAVTAYVRETDDLGILDELVPYANEPGSEAPLLDHLDRALGYTLDRLGPHGLPLIGRADWNDCLNLNAFSESPDEAFQTTENKADGVAESVFIGGLFTLAAREMAALDDHRGRPDDAARRRQEADAMDATVLAHGWDGAWFRRAYDHYGDPVGAAANEEGRIYIEPQGMCVLAGIGLDDGTAVTALDSVATHLATPDGILLVQPAYTRYHIELGEISSYPPGYKENGGVFCHTNPWVIIAETLAGRGDRALDYYLRINPSAREAMSDRHRCEPYVYAQMIAGRDAATPRRGEELVAHRDRGLEPRGDHAVDPRHPPRLRRAARRPVPPRRLARLPRHPPLPRCDLRHHRGQAVRWERTRVPPRRRRPARRRHPGPDCARGRDGDGAGGGRGRSALGRRPGGAELRVPHLARNCAISPVSRRGCSRSSTMLRASTSRPWGSTRTRAAASSKGWMRSAWWPRTSAGARTLRRSSTVGTVGPTRIPCSTAVVTAGGDASGARRPARRSGRTRPARAARELTTRATGSA